MNFHSLLAQLRERMKNSLSMSGFTMIELLVVIAVIGILAVAVLSSINPIEQINKGRDTSKRSDVEQLLSAADRYYAIQTFYPWNRTTSTYTAANTSPDSLFQFDPNTDDWNFLDDLVTTAETKQGFVNRVRNESVIYLYKPLGTNTTLYGCFIPTSYAFKLEAALSCQNDTSHHMTIDGTPTCVTTDGTVDDNNMICLP
jgi:prepilin-type N-terminal cleavage/methylation domain-containing protein